MVLEPLFRPQGVRNEKIQRITGAALGLGLLMATSQIASASPIDVGSSAINFTEATDIGVDAIVGFSHTYVDVLDASLPDVDAKVTILNLSNAEALYTDYSDADPTINSELGLETDILAVGGYVEVKVEFFVSGTSTPATLSGIKINVKDIDKLQWVEFASIKSYKLATGTNLVAQTNSTNSNVAVGSTRFHEPSDVSDSSDSPLFWAEASFNATSSIVFRVGADTIDSAGFSAAFVGATWGVPTDSVTSGGATTTIVPSAFAPTGVDADNWTLVALALLLAGVIATASAARLRRARTTTSH